MVARTVRATPSAGLVSANRLLFSASVLVSEMGGRAWLSI